MNKTIDLTGQRFGRLVVLRQNGRTAHDSRWLCRCDCGTEKSVTKGNLRANTFSCGCLKREKAASRLRTHNASRTPEYLIWGSMIQRCTNPKSRSYANYGGRGIKVDPAWLSFDAFIRAMGPRPLPSLTLERTNNDGNYEPSNCVWATRTTQSRNRRGRRIVTIDGEKMCLSAAVERLGLSQKRAQRVFGPARAS